MSYGITANGFVRKPIDVIRSEKIALARTFSQFADTDFSPYSYEGQLLEQAVQNDDQLWQELEKAYYSVYTNTADGAQLDILNRNILGQPQVYVHRDYHSRNLMLCEEQNPGILDFQDAVYGAITYDLVSLLKDAYVEWEEEQILDWAIRYWEQARKAKLPVNDDFSEFYRDFEWMGAQRHIKVLGIFARLYHRDGKDGYLKDMPLVSKYLRKACERYVQLHPMLKLLDAVEERQVQTGLTF